MAPQRFAGMRQQVSRPRLSHQRCAVANREAPAPELSEPLSSARLDGIGATLSSRGQDIVLGLQRAVVLLAARIEEGVVLRALLAGIPSDLERGIQIQSVNRIHLVIRGAGEERRKHIMLEALRSRGQLSHRAVRGEVQCEVQRQRIVKTLGDLKKSRSASSDGSRRDFRSLRNVLDVGG